MRFVALCATAALLATTTARAQDAPAERAWTPTLNLAFTSQWVDRGLTQTNAHATPQGGLRLDHESGFYVDSWATGVDFGDGTDAEVDLGFGYAQELDNGFSYDLSFYYYLFPGAPKGSKADFWEVIPSVGYDFGPVAWTAAAFLTTRNGGDTGESVYLTTGFSVPLTEEFSIDANVGRSELDPRGGDDYWDWNAGATYATPWFDVDARYHDAGNIACGGKCKGRFAVTISRDFSF
ncbi:MAG: hypothetical protein JNK21_10435 [Rhodospirillaceae bacterium]|nr:hypothetical protein [Rhodospirillaceae bacterium]